MGEVWPDAQVVGTKFFDFRGGVERVEWSWEGGEVAAVSYDLMNDLADVPVGLRPGSIFTLGPLWLVVIEVELWSKRYLVMRDGWLARPRGWWYRSTRWAEIVYRRLVLTAAVWGLAEYHDGAVPAWRDVYLLRRLAQRMEKGTGKGGRLNGGAG